MSNEPGQSGRGRRKEKRQERTGNQGAGGYKCSGDIAHGEKVGARQREESAEGTGCFETRQTWRRGGTGEREEELGIEGER